MKIYKIAIAFILNFYYLLKRQEECDVYDMLQIIAFGLLINAIYGFMHNLNLIDLGITISSAYGIMMLRKDIKDKQC